MNMNNKTLGQWGENKGKKYLRQNNYQILTTNYRNRYGEIDIIARKEDFIIFVEVKTRRNSSFGPPAAAINYHKQQKIKKLAQYFLLTGDYRQSKLRFDVITIRIEQKKAFLKHFKNAF